MKLTDAERKAVARMVAAAWQAKSDRGFGEKHPVRDYVRVLAGYVQRMEGKR